MSIGRDAVRLNTRTSCWVLRTSVRCRLNCKVVEPPASRAVTGSADAQAPSRSRRIRPACWHRAPSPAETHAREIGERFTGFARVVELEYEVSYLAGRFGIRVIGLLDADGHELARLAAHAVHGLAAIQQSVGQAVGQFAMTRQTKSRVGRIGVREHVVDVDGV